MSFPRSLARTNGRPDINFLSVIIISVSLLLNSMISVVHATEVFLLVVLGGMHFFFFKGVAFFLYRHIVKICSAESNP